MENLRYEVIKPEPSFPSSSFFLARTSAPLQQPPDFFLFKEPSQRLPVRLSFNPQNHRKGTPPPPYSATPGKAAPAMLFLLSAGRRPNHHHGDRQPTLLRVSSKKLAPHSKCPPPGDP